MADDYKTKDKEEAVLQEKSLEQIAQEHGKRRSFLSNLLDNLGGKETYTMENMKRLTEKYDTKLSEAGINVEYIPDVAKPYWIRLVNIVKNPESRFKEVKKGLETYITELQGLDEDMTKELYGAGYTSLKSEPGGLYGKIIELGTTRQEYASAILELEKECAETNTRISTLKDKIKQSAHPKDKITHNKQLVAFKFDQTTYEKHKRDLIGKIGGLDLDIKYTKENMKQLEAFQSYVNDCVGKADEIRRSYNATNKDIDYTKKITQIIPQLDNNLRIFREIGDAFNNDNYEKQKTAAKVTKFELKTEKTASADRTSPFADCVREKEKENEATMQRVREINDNPMGDIFDD